MFLNKLCVLDWLPGQLAGQVLIDKFLVIILEILHFGEIVGLRVEVKLTMLKTTRLGKLNLLASVRLVVLT